MNNNQINPYVLFGVVGTMLFVLVLLARSGNNCSTYPTKDTNNLLNQEDLIE